MTCCVAVDVFLTLTLEKPTADVSTLFSVVRKQLLCWNLIFRVFRVYLVGFPSLSAASGKCFCVVFHRLTQQNITRCLANSVVFFNLSDEFSLVLADVEATFSASAGEYFSRFYCPYAHHRLKQVTLPPPVREAVLQSQ